MPRLHSARSSERLVRCSDHMTAMDKKREARQHCQQAAKLILGESRRDDHRAGARTRASSWTSNAWRARQNESLGLTEAFKGANEFGLGLDVA
jgi:hypothetical protein